MKSSLVRTGIAAALVAILAACGGKESFTVRGTITGLAYGGLELVNGSETIHPAAGATTFAFETELPYGATYDVKIPEEPLVPPNTVPVKKNPLHQDCKVSNGADTAGRLAAINVIVTCTTNTYSIGGIVTGLTTDGLVVINGSSQQRAISKPGAGTTGDYTYLFTSPIAYGTSYGVTVFKQPTGQNCVVSNATGIMGDAPVGNINIHCT
jgi:hypothetical protein